MVDWKTYKGQGPWTFSKSQAPNVYNQGHRITTPNDPTWNINFPGIPGATPITPHHDPCGMWTRQYVPLTEPPLPPFTPEVPISPPTLWDVVWVDDGTIHGRFVGLAPGAFTSPTLLFTSQDGITWTNKTPYPFNSINTVNYESLTVIGNMLILGYARTGSTSGIAFSTDFGESWTCTDYYSTWPFDRFDSFAFHTESGLYVATSTQGGSRSYGYESADLLSWNRTGSLALYSRYYSVSVPSAVYLIAYNYAQGIKVTGTGGPLIWTPYGDFIPYLSSTRREMATDGVVITASGGYYVGGSWASGAIVGVTKDYCSESDIWFSNDGSSSKYYYLSRDGIDWTQYEAPGTHVSRSVYRGAVGRDRIVLIGTLLPLGISVLTF